MNIYDIFKPVYYFNGDPYYQIDFKSKHRLISKNKKLKNFLVVDVTQKDIKPRVLSRDDFISKFKLENKSADDVVKKLDTLRYKVFKKIQRIQL